MIFAPIQLPIEPMIFINPVITKSTIYSSIPLPLNQYFYQSRFLLTYIFINSSSTEPVLFGNPASTESTIVSSISLPLNHSLIVCRI